MANITHDKRGAEACDVVFKEYGNRATARDFEDAARYVLAARRGMNADAARDLREARRDMWHHARKAGITRHNDAREFLARVSRSLRESYGRALAPNQYPRATAPALRREIAGYERAAAWRRSESYATRMRGLPCGLQDAAATDAWHDGQMLRLCRIMLRLVEKES